MGGPAAAFTPGGGKRRVAHILVDGADSIGIAAALDRVFVNIGTFGEEWLNCHNPILGVRAQKPFSIAYAQKHSVYWRATEQRTPNLASFLVKASAPMPLREAPGGDNYLTTDQTLLDRGKIVFAETCLACHSSKRPDDGVVRRPEKWSEWAHDEKFVSWARAEVMKPDFLDNNYLSTDARIPITIVQTNAARALQDNATRGKIWEQFSSEDYKRTPSVGDIKVYDPFRTAEYSFTMPSGGPGFYRVPTLVGIWAGAPFLHNNGLGEYNGDPSVEGRMRAFDDAIDKMFNPEQRRGVETIARTTQTSWLVIPAVYLPTAVEGVVGRASRPFTTAPWLLPGVVLLFALGFIAAGRRRGRFARATLITLGVLGIFVFAVLLPLNLFIAGKLGDLKIGPIPKGTPVNVLASINPDASAFGFASAGWKTARALWRIQREGLSDEEAKKVFDAEAGPALMKLCKNQDWLEDRGHYFAAKLPEGDKRALKEYLKTF